MPGNIPQYEGGDVRQQYIDPNVNGGNIGPLAKPLLDAANTLSGFAQEKKDLNDSMWALQQGSAIRQEYAKTKSEMEANSTPGAPKFTDSMMEWYDKTTNDYLSKAPSKEAKEMLQRSTIQYRDSIFSDALNFETKAQIDKMTNDWTETVEINKNVLYHDPTQWRQVYHDLTSSVVFNKLPQKIQMQTKEDLAQSTIMGKLNIINSLDNDNLQFKISAFESLNKEIDSGAWNKYLTSETQFNIKNNNLTSINTLKNKIEQQMKETYAAQGQYLDSLWADHITSIEQTGVGVIPRDKILFLAEKTGNPLLVQKYDEDTKNALNLNNIVKTLDMDNPELAVNKINNLIPRAGDAQYDSKYKTYMAAKKYYTDNIISVIKDPAQYALSKDSVKSAYQRSDKEGIIASLGLQSKFGIPTYSQTILPKDQAINIVKQINSLQPDQIEGFFDDLYKKYNFSIGNGQTAYDKIFSELHNLPEANRLSGNYAILGSVSGLPVANDLIKAIKQGGSLKTALPQGVTYDKILNEVKGNLYDFSKAIGARDRGSNELSDVYNATTYLAMQYLNSGKAGDMSTAANMAAKNLILNQYDIKSSPKNSRYNFYIPKQIDDVKINTNNVYNYLKEKQNSHDINLFIGKNHLGLIFNTTPKVGETKQLTYYADTYIPNLNKQLGTRYKVTSRYRPDSSSHRIGDKVDISMSEQSFQNKIKFFKTQLSNPLVAQIGTSDKEILKFFKSSKIKDLTNWDKENGQNHVNHAHITITHGGGMFGTENSYKSPTSILNDNVKNAVNKGFWATNSSGTGVFLMVENKNGDVLPFMNENGERYEISFKEANKGLNISKMHMPNDLGL